MFGAINSPGLVGYRAVLAFRRLVLVDYRVVLVALDQFLLQKGTEPSLWHI